jgi:transcriptional regulator with XRE-family HTH domain
MFLDPTPIDLHIARRLRKIRTECGVTQDELGELIGVAFQQIQKYEAALNRISAGKLYEICRVLNKPVSSFFDDMKVDEGYYNFEFTPERAVESQEKERGKKITNLIKVFNKIKDEETRLSIINLVSSISKANNLKKHL